MKRNTIRNILLAVLEIVFMFSVFKTCMYLFENTIGHTIEIEAPETTTEVITVTD